jgi:uncharacterized membrane protein YfcA
VHELIVFGAGAIAGAINSVAGGGTLISFPILVWLGVPSIPANATNAVAMWPGSAASAWGYRRELRGADESLYVLVVPSLLGGIAGAILLHRTPTEVFDRLVPVLILFATLIFMAQEPVQRRFNLAHAHRSWAILFQFAVGVYGGYFGAGIGILMLAALSLLGQTHIHQMNGIKNLLALCINAIAAAYFIFAGLVVWPDAIVMGIGSIVGGISGAGIARRLPHRVIRRTVVVIGFGMALSLMLRL